MYQKSTRLAQSIDSDEKKLFYLRSQWTQQGLQSFGLRLKGCGVNLDEIAVAMESTGCYHINLFSFLCAEGLRCAVVNPLLISKFVQGSLRKTKTDKKDAMTHSAVSSEQREEALRGNVIARCAGSEGSGQRTRVSVMDDHIT